jgi:hypothetical protein
MEGRRAATRHSFFFAALLSTFLALALAAEPNDVQGKSQNTVVITTQQLLNAW